MVLENIILDGEGDAPMGDAPAADDASTEADAPAEEAATDAPAEEAAPEAPAAE